MRTGQVGVCLNAGPGIGVLVEEFQHSVAFHCVVAISETEAIGAEPGGAKIRPIDYWPNTVWSNFDLTYAEYKGIAYWARAREGRPYAYLDIAILAVHLRLGWPIPEWLGRWMSRDNSYICSELAACALYYGAGKTLFGKTWPGEVTPDTWLKLFETNGWYTPVAA
jgi:hypothetical protein